jgi:hypothetical protein
VRRSRGAEWELWHQDTFDRESPRRVEVSGRGLAAGLAELWERHLREGVRPDGRPTFSRFNLWWKGAGRSVKVVGEREGQARLRSWIVEGERRIDRALLRRVAEAHARLTLSGETSEAIVAAALASPDRAAFEAWLA